MKQYSVFLLPVPDICCIAYGEYVKGISLHNGSYTYMTSMNGMCIPDSHHLYTVNNDKINTGDFYIKYVEKEYKLFNDDDFLGENCFKVIHSTHLLNNVKSLEDAFVHNWCKSSSHYLKVPEDKVKEPKLDYIPEV